MRISRGYDRPRRPPVLTHSTGPDPRPAPPKPRHVPKSRGRRLVRRVQARAFIAPPRLTSRKAGPRLNCHPHPHDSRRARGARSTCKKDARTTHALMQPRSDGGEAPNRVRERRHLWRSLSPRGTDRGPSLNVTSGAASIRLHKVIGVAHGLSDSGTGVCEARTRPTGAAGLLDGLRIDGGQGNTGEAGRNAGAAEPPARSG